MNLASALMKPQNNQEETKPKPTSPLSNPASFSCILEIHSNIAACLYPTISLVGIMYLICDYKLNNIFISYGNLTGICLLTVAQISLIVGR